MAVLLLVTLTGCVGVYLLRSGPRTAVGDAGWTAAAAAATLGAAVAAWRSAAEERQGWLIMVVACAAWLVGQVLWDVYSVVSFPASPNGADLAWLAFPVFSAAAVQRLTYVNRRSHLVSWLELGPLVVAVCALLVALLWRDLVSAPVGTAARLTALAYPVLYVSTAVMMLQAAVAGALDLRRSPGMAIVLAGLACEAFAFIVWSPQLLAGTYVAGTSTIDGAWMLGLALIGVGAWTAVPVVAVADAEAVRRQRAGILPSLTFCTLASLQIIALAVDAGTAESIALGLGVLAVGATLIFRSAVLGRQQAGLYAQLHERERDLADANARLSEESRRDALTGLANRLRLREDFAELATSGDGFCLVLCDLDRFKAFNDAHGHQAGDRALRRVGAVLDAGTRDGDRVYRYGGEELLIALRGRDERAGAAVAERYRLTLEQAAIDHPGNVPAGVVTFSAGVAASGPGESPDAVLRRADEALYEAKEQGRNRVAVASGSGVDPAYVAAVASATRHVAELPS
jgi:diguanylate cyclase (GGDEF)-like protein